MTTKISRTLRTSLMALAATAVLGGVVATPAFADDWRHDRWREHERHERFEHRPYWHEHVYRPYAYVAPGYGYYYPAPVYPQPYVNFGFTVR